MTPVRRCSNKGGETAFFLDLVDKILTHYFGLTNIEESGLIFFNGNPFNKAVEAELFTLIIYNLREHW